MTHSHKPPTVADELGFHLLLLGGLVALATWGWITLGRPHGVPFWIAIGVPVVHQLYVLLAWRLELTAGKTSRLIGFESYLVIFFVLLVGRVVTLVWLAWVDRDAAGLPGLLRWGGGTVLLGLGLATNYSVARYFGWSRAAGGDHFFEAYRELPLVRRGIFRLTPNAMYVFGFMQLWGIALLFNSTAALVVAAFSHAYIWVHWFATERPDMQYLYGRRALGQEPREQGEA